MAERGFAHTPLTFSGNYEDLFVSGIFLQRGINIPTYFDIGAFAPIESSNTYLFYKRGASGVLVEPNPLQITALTSVRPRDICLHAGVAAESQPAVDFFVVSDRQLSTFDKAKAEQLDAGGKRKIAKIMAVPVFSINVLMQQYGCPNYVSLDTEGYDLPILQGLDFSLFRPQVFCVETITFSEDLTQIRKITDVHALMNDNGYFVYADTFSNTIFVDRAWWLGKL